MAGEELSDHQFTHAVEGAERYSRWIIDSFRRYFGKRVLEIGIGHGAHHRYLPAGVEAYLGVDIADDLVARAKRLYPGTSFASADIGDRTAIGKFRPGHYDTIMCFNVIEHIEDDRQTMRNIMSILPLSGHALIFVPAFRALYGEMDRLAGHHRRYSRGALLEIIPRDLGEIVKIEYFNPVGGLGWWLNRFLRHRSLDTSTINRQVEIFDRFFLPISRLLNPATRRFFGQSIVCVVRRI